MIDRLLCSDGSVHNRGDLWITAEMTAVSRATPDGAEQDVIKAITAILICVLVSEPDVRARCRRRRPR